MLSAANVFGLMRATAQAHDSGFQQQTINQARMGLANAATATMSMADVTRFAAADKALTLQAAHAQLMFEVSQAMLDGEQKRRLQQRQLDERLRQAGALFV